MIEINKKIINGEEITFINYKNIIGFEVVFCDVGAGVYSIKYLDSFGILGEVTCAPRDYETYAFASECFGKVPGRVAGRIKNGKAIIDGEEYQLETNSNGNMLHSASSNTAWRKWDYRIVEEGSITKIIFTIISNDGESGFPGNACLVTTYILDDNKNELGVDFEALLDRPSLVNLTNHLYFNLNGEGLIDEHYLYIDSSKVSKLDNTMAIESFIDVPEYLDYRDTSLIGDKYHNDELLSHPSKGMDHIFLKDHFDFNKEVCILSNGTRFLKVYTTCPAVVVYCGNYTKNVKENTGITFETVIPTNDFEKFTFSNELPYHMYTLYSFE